MLLRPPKLETGDIKTPVVQATHIPMGLRPIVPLQMSEPTE